jgi:hypothetical protein
MKSNKYQPKMFVPSDHMKEERRWWTRLAVIAGIALFLFAFGVGAYIDEQNMQIAIEMGGR